MAIEIPYKSVSELFQNAIDKFGDRPIFGTKKAGKYEWMTFAEFDVRMRKLRSAMKKMGIDKGDVVGIIAGNSVEFALTVYETYGLGAIVVPMYEVQKPSDWEYIIKDAGIKLLVVGNDNIKKEIESFHIENVKRILVIRPTNAKDPDSFNLVVDEETEFLSHIEMTGDEIADYVYTSGTTGNPKGVELSHRNLVEDILRTASSFPIGPTDRTMAFLPWAHAFGKTVELLLFPCHGTAVGLVESNRTIVANFKEVNPTILVSVPKIFTKIYDTVHQKIKDKTVTRMLFAHTQKLAHQAKNDAKLSALDKIQFKVLDNIVGSKVRSVFGNSLRFCISGGAALSEEIAQFFIDFGVEIYEGYGMTECSPVVGANSPQTGRKVGSVGRPFEGVPVRIEVDPDSDDGKQGEIIIGGPIVMQRYHNMPEATAEVLTENHELRTGDMGYLDEDGFLFITGRVKEQYKLENGKYVVPSALEAKIMSSLMIETCVIFGSNKPYNVAVIQPTEDFLKKFKADNNLESATNEALEQNEKLHAEMEAELNKVCESFRGYEKPRKFFITLDEFTIQAGLMTPALKIKRREVEKKYSARIEALYN